MPGRVEPRRSKKGAGVTPILQAELAPSDLRWRCDPADLGFQSTQDLAPLEKLVGQDRAERAISLSVSLAASGFNLFVAGPVGTGRTTAVRTALETEAARRARPSDWCYLHNFEDSYRPNAVELPAGQAPDLRRDFERLVQAFRRDVPKAFESDEFQERRNALMQRLSARRDARFNELRSAAEQLGFDAQVTPMGIVNAPLLAPGKPMSPDAFELLPDTKKAEIRAKGQQLQSVTEDAIIDIRRLEREAREQLRQLEREAALFAVGHFLQELRSKYGQQSEINVHIDAIQNDFLDHLDEYRSSEGSEPASPSPEPLRSPSAERYRVNVLVSHPSEGAPVVFEPNPTYYNLTGRIDYRAAMGAMSTDFTLIKPGALHRANGGFLVVQARDLLTSPFAWDALKRALREHEIRVENLGEQFSAFPTASLKPEAIPLNVKVVIIGDLMTYLLLIQLDEDFGKLFKLKAQFAGDMERTPESVQLYAQFVALQVKTHGLRPFGADAVASVVEYGVRLADDQERLAARFNAVSDLLIEADHWASEDNAEIVRADHVDRALADREWRNNLIEADVQRAIDNGTIAIDVVSEQVGQINGLSILSVGDYAFGRPSRITARTALGADGVVNIEREVKLSGRTHDKGVLILSGYLLGTYAQEVPLALSARLTFEQVYDEIDGDSASGAELCALISSLARAPIRQGRAMTGSVNQFGQIQAVGGVTRKIEGFFDVCQAHGLNGDQGVVIPSTNVRHLMLKTEVVEAVEQGKFHVWSVETIDQALEILTGLPAGEGDTTGHYPEDSIHGRAIARISADVARYSQLSLNHRGRAAQRMLAGSNSAHSPKSRKAK